MQSYFRGPWSSCLGIARLDDTVGLHLGLFMLSSPPQLLPGDRQLSVIYDGDNGNNININGDGDDNDAPWTWRLSQWLWRWWCFQRDHDDDDAAGGQEENRQHAACGKRHTAFSIQHAAWRHEMRVQQRHLGCRCYSAHKKPGRHPGDTRKRIHLENRPICCLLCHTHVGECCKLQLLPVDHRLPFQLQLQPRCNCNCYS